MDSVELNQLSYDELLLIYEKMKDFLNFLEKEKKNLEEEQDD